MPAIFNEQNKTIYEERLLEALQEAFNKKEKLDRAAARHLFLIQFLSEQNIYSYLSSEDYEYLKARCPELFQINPDSDEKNTKWLLDKIDSTKECNWKLFSNYVKAIITVTINSENLYQDIYKETIELMIEGLLDYLFD